MTAKITVLFDADGTILDTMGLHSQLATSCIVSHFGTEVGITADEAQREYHETLGIPFPKQLEVIFPGRHLAVPRQQCVEEYAARKRAEVYGQARVFSDAPDAFADLRSRRAALYVSTSTEADLIADALGRNGAVHHFLEVMGCEHGFKKDHIERVKAVRAAGERMYFVGDTPHDVGLHVHGVTTIGRVGTYPADELAAAGAASVVREFSTLTEILYRE